MAGLTQAQLATRIDMTRSSVANLEAGRQGVPIARLASLGRVLDLDLDLTGLVPAGVTVARNGSSSAGADAEVSAMVRITEAFALLDDLDDPARTRVLKWMADRYGETLTHHRANSV
jgi:transcriptional regulator with XRE-family HTH domain